VAAGPQIGNESRNPECGWYGRRRLEKEEEEVDSSAHALYGWLIPIGLLVGHLGIAARMVSRFPRVEIAARWLAWVFAAILASTWTLWVIQLARLPLAGRYESALSLALVTLLVCGVWEIVGRAQQVLMPLGALIAGALLSHGHRFEPRLALQGGDDLGWLLLGHVLAAWLAFAFLAVNNLLALRIILARGESSAVQDRWFALSLRLGFTLHSAMMVSALGCVLGDAVSSFKPGPTEVLATISWVLYAVLVVVGRQQRLSRRWMAALCLAAFALMAIAFRGFQHFPPPG
jgi:hypothetical protein